MPSAEFLKAAEESRQLKAKPSNDELLDSQQFEGGGSEQEMEEANHGPAKEKTGRGEGVLPAHFGGTGSP
ncbi:uncharacterized protein A1O5_12854 [Cladophialophora psammophila CBS 110553]|uniref:Uncharacterized protein n=1 Tax=Cladophialophora psammophila CBS 110553 TaxID=1182543 RepID=W9VHI2_9EURO|nr:uncharacterized protein A1O5_12854 [Cladophialophora psammophila CBS 110553]EXJ54943.1 hypothetical protein A1O5_12854 [Cladophialophora psammophila CBS 110553]